MVLYRSEFIPVTPDKGRHMTLKIRRRRSYVRKCFMLKVQMCYIFNTITLMTLVSGAHLGPATNFSFFLKFPLDSSGFVIL
jgi:hypothetical protein